MNQLNQPIGFFICTNKRERAVRPFPSVKGVYKEHKVNDDSFGIGWIKRVPSVKNYKYLTNFLTLHARAEYAQCCL